MTDLAPGLVSGPSSGPHQEEAPPGASPSSAESGRWLRKPWVVRSAETGVSVLAALGLTLLCLHISVNPMNRIGQVSGLAKVQQYAALIGLPILGVLLYTAYRGSRGGYLLVQRLACAAIAGMATGVVAGGIAVGLHGTPWGLGGQEGDPGNLMGMANDLMRGKGLPGVYPPGFPVALAAVAKLFYHGVAGVGFAMKDLQLLFTALAGPMAYLAWRAVLRPFWALLIAVPSVVLFLDPIRPYSHTTMIVMVPMLAACLRDLRRAHELSVRSRVLRAAGYGASFGLMFLWYSGWFVWSAPGAMVLALFLIPWRQGTARIRQALAYLGATLLAAGIVGAPLLYEMLRHGAAAEDRYAYITVYVDPAYIMGWASDRAGSLSYHNWPDRGELAGQSGYTLLLLAGAALALGLGLRSVLVRTAAAALVSAWLLRFWFASHMAHAQAVQLYPRTTWIILYCLMILAVVGLMLAVQRGTGLARSLLKAGGNEAAGNRLSSASVGKLVAGGVCVVALFATMGASWSADRYMPSADPAAQDMGLDAYRAHLLQNVHGKCTKYAPVAECAPVNMKLAQYTPQDTGGKLWCADVPTDQWPAVCGRKAPWAN